MPGWADRVNFLIEYGALGYEVSGEGVWEETGGVYPTPLVDNFERAVSKAWGTPDLGPDWTRVMGPETSFSVASGAGRMWLPAGTITEHRMHSSISVQEISVTGRVRLSSMPTGPDGPRSYVIVRGGYRLVFQWRTGTSGLWIQLDRQETPASNNVNIVTSALAFTYSAGQWVRFRFEATGVNPTTLRARVWPDGNAEPTTWNIDVTDSASTHQVAAGIAYMAHSRATATNTLYAEFDELVATDLSVEAGETGSFWDVANWSPVEPTWVPLEGTFYVESLDISRGRPMATVRHGTGRASLTVVWPKPLGEWSWRNPPVGIGREVRIRFTVDGGRRIPLFRGAVRSLDDQWDPDGPLRLTLNLSDRFADLAAVDLPERPNEGLGERTDHRLRRIMRLAKVPTYYARFDAGRTTMASSNFARNLLDEAQVSVESEVGQLYVNRNGFIVFNMRDWWNLQPRSTSVRLAWTNVESQPPDVPRVSPTGFPSRVSLADVNNYISMARGGGTAQVAQDAVSIRRYGMRTHQRYDLVNQFSSDVMTVAEYRLAQLKNRTRRLDTLTTQFDFRTITTADLTAALDVELGDLHQVYWDDGSGTPLDMTAHVMGVTHRVRRNQWEVGVDLWDYVGYSPTLGWGVAIWDETTWWS